MYKIMIIEDEADIREELALLLKNEGYQVTAPTEFTDAEVRVAEENLDLILLDVGLPGRDGFSVCMDIRKASPVPIIFVTSRNTSMDELKALSLGGDDYVTKPYNIPVLIARIKALLRRITDAGQGEHAVVNGLRPNLSKGCLEHNGQICEATKNELKILSCLMAKPGEIVSRADLIEYLWDNQIYIDDNTLSVNVTQLRAKLNKPRLIILLRLIIPCWRSWKPVGSMACFPPYLKTWKWMVFGQLNCRKHMHLILPFQYSTERIIDFPAS